MASKNRVVSIDIMRGVTLFLMLFVNDLFVPGVPKWLVHTDTNFDGMGLADWVFAGFLFMVGMSVPFAVKSRKKRGDSALLITWHILLRTISLLFIGVLMLNTHRLNPELAGVNRMLWAILVYVCIFLIWNHYPEKPEKKIFYLILKLAGCAGLIVLLSVFKAGAIENPTWLITGWWGILGLIGWGYLTAALVFLFLGERICAIFFAWLVFVVLNVLSELSLLTFMSPLKPILGVLISGNTPSIVLAGMLFSLIFQRLKKIHYIKLVFIIILAGAAVLLLGFVLRNWFIISKNRATPSWAMICNGISIILFGIIYFLADGLKITRWATIFNWVGKNSLTTYLSPNIIYFTIWSLSLPVFYKQSESQLLAVAGSLAWAFFMMMLSILLSKIGIRLKL